MYKRLYCFLQSNDVLYKYQFGFRKLHSTIHALLETADIIYKHLDRHKSVISVYLDLEKAFDTVNYEILLYKMYNYGIRGCVYNWFQNYLYERTQFISVNGYNSKVSPVKCGIP